MKSLCNDFSTVKDRQDNNIGGSLYYLTDFDLCTFELCRI